MWALKVRQWCRKGTIVRVVGLTAIDSDTAQYTFASQLAVLRSCPDVISHTLKHGRSLLLAAKVLVIARLLHTKLSKRANAPPYLDLLRSRLATLRDRLLVKIDRRFKSLATDRGVLVEAMCAFAISTSSSPTDVVRHFHHARLEAIGENMEREGTKTQDLILQALRLYVKTLRDSKAIVPGQLSLALQGIKAIPIFKSQDVAKVAGLNLDIYQRWIDEDIQSFTPYIRHDELTRVESDKLLRFWATKAIRTFLTGLRTRVSLVKDIGPLMNLRRDLLEVWLSQHHHGAGVDAGEVLDGLRDVFNNQAEVLIRDRCLALREVVFATQTVIDQWQPGTSDNVTSLWSPTIIGLGTSNGAKALRQHLINITAGKDDTLLQVCQSYTTWLHSISEFEKVTQETKAIKWTDNIDDIEEEDDLLDDKQTLLSEDDPQFLITALQRNLTSAFSDFESNIQNIATTLTSKTDIHKLVFLLRLLRSIRANLPPSSLSLDLSHELIPTLYSQLADAALLQPLQGCQHRFAKFTTGPTFPSRALWEGDPEIPVLPSPWAYRFLLELTQSMAGLGADNWTPAAVGALKVKAAGRVVDVLAKREEKSKGVNGDMVENGTETAGEQTEESGQTEGDVKVNGTHGIDAVDPTLKKEKASQQFFDVVYLRNAFAVKGQISSLQDLESTLLQDVQLDSEIINRVRTGAAEYWDRTSLLLGLLG